MVDPTIRPVDSIEEKSDLGSGDSATWAYWMGQEAIAEHAEKEWQDRGDKIIKRFRDERDNSAGSSKESRFNALWSNVKTLMPVLYARTPKPDVDRRWKDGTTATARYASIILERCLQFACDTGNFDGVMKPAVQDRLLPGRGVARVLYVPHFGEAIEGPEVPDEGALASQAQQSPGGIPSPDVQQTPQMLGSPEVEEDEKATSAESDGEDATVDAAGDDKKETDREVVYEEGEFKYIFWKDYREGPARQWKEVPWIRYRAYETRKDMRKRFGEKKADQVNLDYTPEGHTEADKDKVPPDLYKKAIVHEYWEKATRKVFWIAPGTPDLVLDEQNDPLGLPDFYPNPDPLLATTTTDTRIPVPDYCEYQDQAEELDRLTARISKLTRALAVKGVYPGETKHELQQLIDSGENQLIPVHDWDNWSDRGGMTGIIQWFPVKEIAETLIQLYDARDRVKAILYELTGIGDIMRGMTSPDETLGAQELKSVFATRRITPEQKEVARFARDLLRLMSGIIAGHFSDQTISQITGFPVLAPVPQLPPPPQASPQVQLEIAIHQVGVQPPARGAIGAPGAVPLPPPGAPAGMPPPGAAAPPGQTIGGPGMPPGAAGGNAVPRPQAIPSGGPPGVSPPIPPQNGAPAAAGLPAAPPGGNVVPIASPGGSPLGMPGVAPPQPQQPPPLSPQAQQFMQQQAQFKQAQQAVQAITQANAKKQAEFKAACQLIREDGVHGFKIDIEADSTIAPDEQAEKAARTEFLGKFIPIMEQAIPMAMGNPPIASFVKEIVLFGVRAFPVARPLEEAVEQAFDAIAKMPPQPPPGAKGPQGKQGPTPQELALRGKENDTRLQIARENNAEKMFNAEQDRQADAEKLQADTEKDRTELALKLGRAAKQDALAGARLTHIETQNASGLV